MNLNYIDPECTEAQDKALHEVSGFVAGKAYNEICKFLSREYRWPDCRLAEEAPFAHEFFIGLMTPQKPETVTLLGEKADGSRDVLGAVPMPPKMKAREIARSYFGESSGEGDEADMCLWALEELHDWMLKQGWQPPPMTLTPNA